jgi:hypothetical protein
MEGGRSNLLIAKETISSYASQISSFVCLVQQFSHGTKSDPSFLLLIRAIMMSLYFQFFLFIAYIMYDF